MKFLRKKKSIKFRFMGPKILRIFMIEDSGAQFWVLVNPLL